MEEGTEGVRARQNISISTDQRAPSPPSLPPFLPPLPPSSLPRPPPGRVDSTGLRSHSHSPTGTAADTGAGQEGGREGGRTA